MASTLKTSLLPISFFLFLPVLALSQSSSAIVDLGYEIHQGNIVAVISQSCKVELKTPTDHLQENTRYLNFSNIRYAAPPLGELRFTAPAPPLNNRSSSIQDGSFGPPCSQAVPLWSGGSLDPLSGNSGSEDCLFLDVFVAKDTFKTAQSNQTALAPVIVWIYGGGFVLGSKTASGCVLHFCLFNSANHFHKDD